MGFNSADGSFLYTYKSLSQLNGFKTNAGKAQQSGELLVVRKMLLPRKDWQVGRNLPPGRMVGRLDVEVAFKLPLPCLLYSASTVNLSRDIDLFFELIKFEICKTEPQ